MVAHGEAADDRHPAVRRVARPAAPRGQPVVQQVARRVAHQHRLSAGRHRARQPVDHRSHAPARVRVRGLRHAQAHVPALEVVPRLERVTGRQSDRHQALDRQSSQEHGRGLCRQLVPASVTDREHCHQPVQVWELGPVLGHVPVLEIALEPALCRDWAIVPALAIDRHVPTLVIARIDFRIDWRIEAITLVIGWRIEVIVRRTAVTTGTTGTDGITTITATGITVTGTATGGRDRDGITGGTAIRC